MFEEASRQFCRPLVEAGAPSLRAVDLQFSSAATSYKTHILIIFYSFSLTVAEYFRDEEGQDGKFAAATLVVRPHG